MDKFKSHEVNETVNIPLHIRFTGAYKHFRDGPFPKNGQANVGSLRISPCYGKAVCRRHGDIS